MVRRPRHHACSWSAGNRPTRASPTRASTIMCSTGRSTRSTPSATCSASRASTRSAIASPERRSRRRSLTLRRRARRTRSSRRPSSPRRSISPRPATSSCSSATRRWALLDQLTTREGLSRRPLHGRDLQPAARPRPHLELCRQQLPAGRGAGAVRPAALEQRHHQPAGRLAPRLSRDALQGEQAGRERRDQASPGRRSTSTG